MNLRLKRIFQGVRVIFFVLVILLLSFYIQKTFFRFEISELKHFLNLHGVLAPVVYLILLIIFVVVIPLPDFLLFAAATLIFPWFIILPLTILGNMIGAYISFYLAKKYGFKLIKKLLSRSDLEFIHSLGDNINWKGALILRLLPGSNFGLLNYFFGFTNLDKKTFLQTTFFGSLPLTILSLYFLEELSNEKNFLVISSIWVIFMFLMPFLFPLFKNQKKRD